MKKFALFLLIFLLLFTTGCDKEVINGIEKYDKKYFVDKYSLDLDTDLSIFPDSKEKIVDGTFKSIIEEGLLDSSGFILLDAHYNEEDYRSELERLSKINITINETCRPDTKTYTNYIKYEETSYDYPAYVSIDGFTSKYEYALLNEKDFEIIYVYIAYPELDNENYKDLLKKDKKEYSKEDTLKLFSIYSHTFDGGRSYSESSDCR